MPYPVLLTIAGAIIAFFGMAEMYHRWNFAINRGKYSPKVFVVHEIVTKKTAASRGGRGGSYLVATGVIDGSDEVITLSLEDLVDVRLLSEANMDKVQEQYPAGSRVDVWHKPNAADTIVLGNNPGLLPASVFGDPALLHALRVAAIRLSILFVGLVWLVLRFRGKASGNA